MNETRKGKSREAVEKALENIDAQQSLLIYVDEKLEHGIL